MIKGLATSIIKRPLCTVSGAILGTLMIWIGLSLVIPDGSIFGTSIYSGVKLLTDLHVWGYAFIVAGLCAWARIALLSYEHLSMALHIPALLVATAWAIGFYFSPVSPAQAMYTFLAGYVFVQPFIPKITLAFVRFAGYHVNDPIHIKARYDMHDIKCKLDVLLAEMTRRGD